MARSILSPRLTQGLLRWTLPSLAVVALAACGVAPNALPVHPLGVLAAASHFATDKPFITPDYQTTLVLGPHDKPIASWYDVKGQQGKANLDAQDIAALAGTSAESFQAYLSQHKGPVALYVGGLGDEAQAWNSPFKVFPGVPSIVLKYALDPYTGFEQDKRFWFPWGKTWQSSLLPFDALKGLPNYNDDVRYGASLVDRMVNKLEAAGAGEVWLFGHSKGADVVCRSVYDPGLHLDHRHDAKLTRVWTFAMPFIAAHTPESLGFHSKASHWGGFFKAFGGKVVMYNRNSDFVTYGGWVNMSEHDYSNVTADCSVACFPGKRGKSPNWSSTENFMSRMQTFAASDALSDQSPATLTYDW
jgi:hypothetical protein